MPKPIVIISVLLFCSIFGLNAQVNTINLCDSAFSAELNTFIFDELSNKDAAAFVNTISASLNNSFFIDTDRQAICDVAYYIVKTQKLPFETLKTYFNTISVFAQKPNHRANFNQFHSLLHWYCIESEASITSIIKYINDIHNLMYYNTVFKNEAITWQLATDNFQFTVEPTTNTITVNVTNNDLKCYARNDSMVITKTTGIFSTSDRIYYGEKGKITWIQAGYHPDSVYAEFNKFQVDILRSMVTIDTVSFYNLTYSKDPMMGTLQHQVSPSMRVEDQRYPRFESFLKRFRLDRLYPDIDYIGGYVQHGSRFVGSGTKEEPALLYFWREMPIIKDGDTTFKEIVFMRTASTEYVFTKNRLFSMNAEVSMYLDFDSIYHPGLELQYNVFSSELSLLRNNNPRNMSRSPYYNSYHKLEMSFELLKWNTNESQIYFTHFLNTEISNATFESYNYFASERFYKIQGLATTHPLFEVRRLIRQKKSNTFTAEELAKIMRSDITAIKLFLIELSYEGYIYYDREAEVAQARAKLFDYLDAATRRKDYDVISIVSTVEGQRDNAILELKNLNLSINGVQEFPFSRANNVIAQPSSAQLVLQKDRTINFGGIIRTGLYTFYGKKFIFDYNLFQIDIDKADSMAIHTSAGIDRGGFHIIRKVNNRIEDVNGTIYIDSSSNKSGIYSFTKFPIFESSTNSFVYYDMIPQYGTQYARDSIYFEIDPYFIDSLNNPEAEQARLTGTFYTGNIFPLIREELQIQRDLSFGFTYETPVEGLPAYGGKGQVFATIDVNNTGIRGRGSLNVMNSTTWSNNFIFLPNNTEALADKFINRSTTTPSMPLIEGTNIAVNWLPYRDELIGTTSDKPVDMYNAQAKLAGTFTIRPQEATGRGSMDMDKCELTSENFLYTEYTIDAANSTWKLATLDKSNLAVNSTKINAHIDFNERKGTFNSPDPTNAIQFPVNLYMAYIDGIEWEMDNDKLFLTTQTTHSFDNLTHKIEATATTMHPAGSLFISTDKKQDQLNFISPHAEINLKTNIINAQQIPFIKVSDAIIEPSDGNLFIEPQAQHKTLVMTKIKTLHDSIEHSFYDATINISGRLIYSGDGKYDYIDFEGNKQVIKFASIAANKQTKNTYATTELEEYDAINLNSAFTFMGNIELFAPKKNMNFKGFFKMLFLPDTTSRHWVKFDSEIDANNVMIDVKPESFNHGGQKLVHSIVTNMDSTTTYPAFFAETTKPNYHEYTTVEGLLRYDYKSLKYEAASLERFENPKSLDNYISFNTNNSEVYTKGAINIVRDFYPLTANTRGTMNYSKERNELLTDMFLYIDFFFNERNLQMIADTLNTIPNNNPVNMKSLDYEQGMTGMIGAEATNKLMEEQQLFGSPKTIPENFSHTIVITDLNMRWDTVDQAFKSIGNIGIGSILNTSINKMVKGTVELRYEKNTPEMFIYIEPAQNLWYYFKYTHSALTMATVSSDTIYNAEIKQLKKKERTLKNAVSKSKTRNVKKTTDYVYGLTLPRIKDESLFYFKEGRKDEDGKRRRIR